MARSLLFLSLFVCACTNLEDANVPTRQSFIRFFGSARSFTSVVVESDVPRTGSDESGFVMLGNITPVANDVETQNLDDKRASFIVVTTNKQGTETSRKVVLGAYARAIKPVSDGYLVTGESIELNPQSGESSEFVNSKFLLIKLNQSLEETARFEKDSSVTVSRGTDLVTLKVDFKATSSVILPGGTEVATLGSYKVPGGQERSITLGFNLSNISTSIWRKNLDLTNFDYINTNSLGVSSGNLVWASTAAPTDVNQVSYISVITTPPNYASPSNNSLFGKGDESGAHEVKDVEPSATGFAIIGTYTSKSGNKDVFFVRVDPAGNIITSSAKYFDCADPSKEFNKNGASESQDEGSAVTFTRDGGFILACTMTTTVDRGNGGTDVVLIKIDAFGNYKWNRILGGGGNEVATSIRELSDGTLLISGTSTVSNVSSMFIMRTDANGELKD